MTGSALRNCVWLLTSLAAAGQQTVTSPEPGISIRVVQGDGAINSIRMHRAYEPVAQVVDQDGEPVTGATVTFLLPATGPSGTFQNSGQSLTIQTDDKGMAAGRGLKPNGIAGQFRIRVTASLRGDAASATLTQTNAEPVAKTGHGKTIAIVALIVGGIAGGAAAVASQGGSGSAPPAAATPTQPAGTIVSGAPSFGPPR